MSAVTIEVSCPSCGTVQPVELVLVEDEDDAMHEAMKSVMGIEARYMFCTQKAERCIECKRTMSVALSAMNMA
jgi:hypothetical protein